MTDVSIRDLRNRGGELTGLPRPPVALDELRRRWKRLPPVDPAALRHDIDDVIDASL